MKVVVLVVETQVVQDEGVARGEHLARPEVEGGGGGYAGHEGEHHVAGILQAAQIDGHTLVVLGEVGECPEDDGIVGVAVLCGDDHDVFGTEGSHVGHEHGVLCLADVYLARGEGHEAVVLLGGEGECRVVAIAGLCVEQRRANIVAVVVEGAVGEALSEGQLVWLAHGERSQGCIGDGRLAALVGGHDDPCLIALLALVGIVGQSSQLVVPMTVATGSVS